MWGVLMGMMHGGLHDVCVARVVAMCCLREVGKMRQSTGIEYARTSWVIPTYVQRHNAYKIDFSINPWKGIFLLNRWTSCMNQAEGGELYVCGASLHMKRFRHSVMFYTSPSLQTQIHRYKKDGPPLCISNVQVLLNT